MPLSQIIKLMLFSGGGLPTISVSPSSWDFGSTSVGTPVEKEFTISNTGTATLNITLPITSSDPAFTITAQPGSTSLAPGASTTFTMQATAASVGAFNANISITNNSAENPKLVPITATVTIVTSGLVAWYDANDASTRWEDSARTIAAADNADVIGAWDDKSGNAYHLLQTTTANKPTLRTNVQNGKPVIRGDGVNDYLVKAFGTSYAQPNTIIAVLNHKTNAGASSYAYDGSADGNRHAFFNSSSTQMDMFAGAGNINYVESFPTGMFIHEVVVNGGSSKILENGTVKDNSGDIGANPLTGLTLFARFNAASFGTDDIAEFLFFDRALTDTELSNMRSYLNTKWAVY